jgi:hypothetical protein
MTDVAELFHRDSYAVLPRLLQDPQLCQIYKYVRKIAQAGLMATEDGQVSIMRIWRPDHGRAISDPGKISNLLPALTCSTYSFARLQVWRHSKKHRPPRLRNKRFALPGSYEAEKPAYLHQGPPGPSRVNGT